MDELQVAQQSLPATGTNARSRSTVQGGACSLQTAAVLTEQLSAPDRFMRKMLRVEGVQKSQKLQRQAQRNFQLALFMSGIRCTITYVLIPVLVPIIGLSGMVAAPVGILLSLFAVLTGISSLRQFWRSNHRYRWMYTYFITFVFLILAVALVLDFSTVISWIGRP